VAACCAGAITAERAQAAKAPEAVEVGVTVTTERQVTATFAQEKRQIRKGNVVRLNEVVETGKSAQGEFKLRDDTKLAIGPESKLVLDEFIFDPNKSAGSVTLNLTKGAFRFITGKMDSKSYKLRTPTATLGIRGTVFDVFVAASGEMAVLLHAGAVEVCTASASCRLHRTIGRFVHIGLTGVISGPIKWDGSFLPGINIGSAFPFVGKALRIDPIRRFKQVDLMGGRALRDARRALGKTTGSVTKGLRKGRGKIGGSIRKMLPF
jgi:hypothetical protein